MHQTCIHMIIEYALGAGLWRGLRSRVLDLGLGIMGFWMECIRLDGDSVGRMGQVHRHVTGIVGKQDLGDWYSSGT
jgi:hypothetical protein